MKTTDILVIGGGAAGLSAAAEAASAGAKVTILESDLQLGGQLIKQTHKFFGSKDEYAGTRGYKIADILLEEIRAAGDRVEVHTNTTVTGYYREDGTITAMRGEEEYFRVQAKKVVVATGAQERLIPFPNNDLPGVYGAGAVQTLMNVAGVKPAERVLMVGAGNIGLIVSYQLMQAGVEVAGIIEAAPKIGGYLVHASKIRRAGVPIRTGYTIEKAYGTDALEGVVIVQVDSQFQPVPGTEETIPCDTLCLAVGLAPLTELCWQAGCDMAFIRELSGHIPLTDENLETSVPGVYAAGDVSGIEEASSAMVEGRLAGCAAAESLGYEPVRAAAEKEAARSELSELRSGPAGARILSGLEKARKLRLEHDICRKGGASVC